MQNIVYRVAIYTLHTILEMMAIRTAACCIPKGLANGWQTLKYAGLDITVIREALKYAWWMNLRWPLRFWRSWPWQRTSQLCAL